MKYQIEHVKYSPNYSTGRMWSVKIGSFVATFRLFIDIYGLMISPEFQV